jgi:nitroreductase
VAATTDDLGVILESAGLAPSVHNTQPWRFEVDGDTIEVRADPSRQLGYLDPAGRQLRVSCGAAIEFGYLAARACGRACEVAVLPDPTAPELLARLTLGDPLPATPEELRLADAIATRYTDRGPYSDERVPPAVIADIGERATQLGAWARELSRPDHRQALIAVLYAAEQAEAGDAEYAKEIAAWTNTGGDVGIAPEATAPMWPGDRVPEVPLRDFSGFGEHPRPADSPDAPPTVERDLLLVIGTEADDPWSWLAAGRALGAALLRAAAEGIAAQPLGQAIDLPYGRERLRHELGMVGHPQFVLRMGYGSGRPRTRRRTSSSA